MSKRLIDADAVEKVLEEKHFRRVLDSDRWVIADIKKSIMELPTIDAEPVRHGKWTVTPIYIKCSECGESFMLIPQNYCPYCGADMRGEEEWTK